MKHFIILLGLSLSSLFLFSQSIKYRAFEAASCKPDHLGAIVWSPRNILVVLNAGASKVKIFSEALQDIDILYEKPSLQMDDGSTMKVYSAVDDGGNNCDMYFVSYNNQEGDHSATLILDYPNVRFLYRLKAD